MKLIFQTNQNDDSGSIQNRLASYVWCQYNQVPQNGLDLTFICSNGSLSVHKFILQAASPTIFSILNHAGVNATEHVSILVPEFNLELVRKCVQVIYTGAVSYHNENERNEGIKFCLEQLKIDENAFVELDPAPKHPQPAYQHQQQQCQVSMTKSPNIGSRQNKAFEVIPPLPDVSGYLEVNAAACPDVSGYPEVNAEASPAVPSQECAASLYQKGDNRELHLPSPF